MSILLRNLSPAEAIKAPANVSREICEVANSVLNNIDAKCYGIDSCLSDVTSQRAKIWKARSGCFSDVCPPPFVPQDACEPLCVKIKKKIIITEGKEAPCPDKCITINDKNS